MRLILFEMNEVPIRILDDWIVTYPASALARSVALGRVYRSRSEDGGHLSPWVTWPSLHRGVTNNKHFIADFGQNLDHVDAEFPPIWTLAVQGGARVGVFNSLHSHPLPANLSNVDFHVPDPFAPTAEAHPKSMKPFQSISLAMSRESGRNVANSGIARSAVKLMASLPALGIRPTTIIDVARQLIEERRDSWKLVRRRTYQSVLTFDIFMRRLERTKPHLATYFTNHVASAMHRYWGATYPDDFATSSFDVDWSSTYGGEIDFSMQRLDAMVGRLLVFVERNPDYQIVLASSMGQEAVESSLVETQLYLVDPGAFLAQLGVPPGSWKVRPAMLPQVNIQVTDEIRGTVENALQAVLINKTPLTWRTDGAGFFSMDFGHANIPDDVQVQIDGTDIPYQSVGLKIVEITDRSGTTAYHIPEGTLILVGAGVEPTKARSQVSTTDIAPHILRQLGLTPPTYMSRNNLV